MKLVIAVILLLSGRTSTSTVPQCPGQPALQQLMYSIASTTKKVCLLSEEDLIANFSLHGAAWPIGNVTTTPGTTAACALGTNIYVDQKGLTGSGSIAFEYGSGNAFALVYAPRGLYNTNKTVISVAAGDPEPVEPLWLSYGIPSWLVCELVNGGRLRQPSYTIAAFDNAPDCLVSSVVTLNTNVRAVRVVFNSSHVPIGNHSIVLMDGSYGACDAITPLPSFLPFVTLIVTATNNTTTGTPLGNATITIMPIDNSTYSMIPLIIGITVAVTVFILVVVVVVVVSRVILVRNQRKNGPGQDKPVNGSSISLNLNHFEHVAGDVAGLGTSNDPPMKSSTQTSVTVVVEKKDAPWIPLLSAKLGTLHNCSCNVVEFQDFVLAQLEDQKCQRVYAVWSGCEGGEKLTDSHSTLVDDFKKRLSSHVTNDKLLMTHFGLDSDIDGYTDMLPNISYHPTELSVETAEECAAEMHCTHITNSRPSPLDLSGVLNDRSRSATPPSSATRLLQDDSGVSSLTNSDQNTPDMQYRHTRTNKFPKGQQSQLVNAFLLQTHEQLKDIKCNTDYLVNAAQKNSLEGSEQILLS